MDTHAIGEYTMADTGGDDRLTVAEAARRLQVSNQAVRKRITRGTLASDKDPDGTVHVYLPPDKTPTSTADLFPEKYVEELREQVSYLRRQLDEEREANRENRRLLAAALERIPEIEAPGDTASEPRERTETATEQPKRVETPPEREPAQPRRAPWWRRMFGQ